MKKIAMESVVLTTEAVAAWHVVAKRAAAAVRALGVRREDVSEEEIWISDDEATLVIKCQAGPLEVSMDVPAGQWSWNN